MATLIKLDTADTVVIPPEGYITIFYTREADKVLKKAKLSDGSVVTISEE